MTSDLCDSCLIYFGLHVTLILIEIAQFASIQSIKGKTAFSMKIALYCISPEKGGVVSQFKHVVTTCVYSTRWGLKYSCPHFPDGSPHC